MMIETPYTETEEKIFRAALRIFARDGKKGATMQEIADAAGINKALVHYYFRSKEKLYNDVFNYIIRTYFNVLAETIAQEHNFVATLKTFVHRYVDTIDKNPVLFQFMIREMLEGAPTFKKNMSALHSEQKIFLPKILIDRIALAVKRKEIRSVDPIQLLITIFGACLMFFLQYPLIEIMEPAMERRKKKFIEERKAHIIEIILHGIQK